MGFLIALPKESNGMYTDYPNAYWYLDNIRTIYENGTQLVLYDVSAYPSRDVKNHQGYWLKSAYPFGNPMRTNVDACLYRFTDKHPAVELFPDGMPADLSQVKSILYNHFKTYLNELGVEYTDVLENDNLPEEVVE